MGCEMKKKYLLLTGGALFLLLAFFGYQWMKGKEVAAITNEEAKQLIEKMYPGELLAFGKENNHFIADVERTTGVYRIALDEEEGKIVAVEKVREKVPEQAPQQEVEKAPAKPASPDETVTEPTKRMTQDEAVQIALSHVPGEIEDIDTENIQGILHYLIEVEDEDVEATIEINSITGEIRSITWDD